MKEEKNKKNTTSKTKVDEPKKEKALSKIDKKEEKSNKKFFTKFFEVLSKKWLVNGATTLLLVLIIIAIYFGVNLLLKKVTLPEIDCTTNKVYSLSDETKTKISNLDKDVKITLINYGDNDTTKNMAEKYKSLNKKITIEEIDDISSREDIKQEYSISSTDTLIVVECGDKKVTLSASDLYTYDYSTYEQIDITEEAITNAIVNVTADSKPKVYFMSSHTAYDPATYYTRLMETIKNDANEVDTVDLLTTGKVPDDCDCLVITTLKEDITEPEKEYITTYINNGGKLLLLCGANLTGNTLTNFQSVLDLYGVTIQNGVLFEGSTSNMISKYPDIILEDVTANSTTKNQDMNLKACFVDAAAIQTTTDTTKQTELGVEYENLIKTSKSAFIRNDLNNSSLTRTTSDSEVDSYTIGVLATKKINDNVSSKLILYSASAFDQLKIGNYTITAYNNQDIVANSIAYLNEKGNTISIRKNYDSVTMNEMTQKQSNIVMAIIFLTPLAIIIAGIIVSQIRKHKNK